MIYCSSKIWGSFSTSKHLYTCLQPCKCIYKLATLVWSWWSRQPFQHIKLKINSASEAAICFWELLLLAICQRGMYKWLCILFLFLFLEGDQPYQSLQYAKPSESLSVLWNLGLAHWCLSRVLVTFNTVTSPIFSSTWCSQLCSTD